MNPLYFIGWCILIPIYKLMFVFKVNGKESKPFIPSSVTGRIEITIFLN